MKIGFDLDGVLRDGSLGFLKLCLDLGLDKTGEALNIANMTLMRPLLNPFLFTTKDDEIYVVTNAIRTEDIEQKKNWVKHFLGDRVKLIITQVATGNKWGREYVDPVAIEKVRVLEKNGIEIYFDDDPAIVETMRDLTSKVKILKYGSWIDEYY